jgi:dihydrofolate reductase
MTTIAIVTSTATGGIGNNDRLPWFTLNNLRDNFDELATDQIVLVGGSSFNTHPYVRGAITYVYTTTEMFEENDALKMISGDPADVIAAIQAAHPDKNIIIGGGKTVFEKFYDLIDEWRVTIIEEFALFNKDIDWTNIQYLWKDKTVINSGQDGN